MKPVNPFCVNPFCLVVLIMCVIPLSAAPVAPVYNVRLVTDSTPDLTDMDSYLRSITSQFGTEQEKAVAVWRWSQKLRKQASNPAEDGREILDPLQLFNSYGHCNCGIISGVNNALWLNLGWKAHYVQLGDHTVCETSWDGGKAWHMFDASTSFYCFNDKGEVASVEEIEKNPRYYFENFAPECGTNAVKGPEDTQGWRQASDWPAHYQRTLANGWDSYRAPNGISSGNLYAQWGQKFVLNLRPDESYTRHFGKAGAKDAFRPLPNGNDVETQHGNTGIRANGVWLYEPDLRGEGAEKLVYDSQGLRWGDAEKGYAVRPVEAGADGVLLLRISAANVVAAAKMKVVASRATAADKVAIEVSHTAGASYEKVWEQEDSDIGVESEINLTGAVGGVSEYLVKVTLSGKGAGLEAVSFENTTQINRASLPRLSRGPNRVQLTLGRQVETVQFQPSVTEGKHSKTVAAEHSVDVEKETGYYKPTLRPAENGVACFVMWKISTPAPITRITYGGNVCVKSAADSVTLSHSWDGKVFEEDFTKDDAGEPFDLMVLKEVDKVPAGSRKAFFRYGFETAKSEKSYTGPGIQTARMTVEHEPKVKGFTPVEVTYCWTEHREDGDVERRHTEMVENPAHEYVIKVGGYRDPTMKWLQMNLKGYSPEGGEVSPGYSDGEKNAAATPRQRWLFEWGTNLAKGKGYTLTGGINPKNPDAGTDLTDGVVAPPDEDVSEKYMPTNVMFASGETATATMDLGKVEGVAAVRVQAGQEPGFHLAFPETITVEASVDGKTFAAIGAAEHNQVFDPPANFQPWENDDSPKYSALPAGGRLAYAYRIVFAEPTEARYLRVTCKAQDGWGMLLSEIEAYDSVSIKKDLPPEIVLPPLPR